MSTINYSSQLAQRAYFGEQAFKPVEPLDPQLDTIEDLVVEDTQRREVLGHGQCTRTKIDAGMKTSPAIDEPEFTKEPKVSEVDMAAYCKEDLEVSLRQQIMRRMFCAFDSVLSGYLDIHQVEDLCRYLGRHLTQEQVEAMAREIASESADPEKVRISFEQFWSWWESRPDSAFSDEAFSVIRSDFSVAYHQQQLELEEEGEVFTPSYRVKFFFRDLENGFRRQVSPWHDLPFAVRDPVRTKPAYIAPNRFNFICEVPKWTRAKFEIATGEPYNPIKQDLKHGIPRFYKHGDMMWNYGAFPQTWESTEIIVEGVVGDNDPLDGIEIGMRQMRVGAVTAVKVLGILGMIDDGQMDWKVIIIAVDDPVARFIRDIDDVPKFLPGCLDAIREFFRVYKICQGGVENKFAFDGEFRDKEYALRVMRESHHMWNNLRKIKGKDAV